MLLAENLSVFGIRGKFLDFGCGRGDVAEFLIRQPEMREGLAFDLAMTDEQVAASTERGQGKRLRYSATLEDADRNHDLAVLFDVIEHVPDTSAILKQIHDHVRPGGWLAITVPYNAHEWGVDDEFYGHLRRLSMRGIVSMGENNGWDVVRVLDPSYPTFWFVRKVYLWTRKFTGKPVQVLGNTEGSDIDRTLRSARQSAWNTGGLIPKLLSGGLLPWKLIRKLDYYFESTFKGFELFVMCQKRIESRDCGVCGNGHYSYSGFYQRYAQLSCRYCATEKIIGPDANPDVEASEKRLPGFMSRLLMSVRTRRLASMIRGAQRAESMLIVARDPDGMINTDRLTPRPSILRTTAVDNKPSNDWLADPGAPYDCVALFHVIEHVDDIGAIFESLNRLVRPGGELYLEFPNSRSLLKRLFRWRWFGYDPPHHRFVIDALFLSDQLGLRNYRLLAERHFVPEYSFLIFIQTLLNALLPFQRDAFYSLVRGYCPGAWLTLWGVFSIPLAILLSPLFFIHQPIVSWLRAGCVVQQTYRRTDIVS